MFALGNVLQIFFSRTSQRISIKLYTNHPYVKGIQVCTNEKPGPLQNGDNHKNAKIGWSHLKIYFSRTTGPQKLKFTQTFSEIVLKQVFKIMVSEVWLGSQ
jgi:hypothetical protein